MAKRTKPVGMATQSRRGDWPDWWKTALPGTQIAHLVWISTSGVCLEKLRRSEGVGLWVHSIRRRERAEPRVKEGVCCRSHARVLRL